MDRSRPSVKKYLNRIRRFGLILFAFLLIESGVLTAAAERHRARVNSSSHADDLFRRNCARCHGADGRGDTPLGKISKAPDFTDREWWESHRDITSKKNLATIVGRGKGAMPAFGRKLSRAEINLLATYVRRFRNQNR